MAKPAKHEAIQIIKTQSQKIAAQGDWDKTKALAKEVEKQSQELESILDDLAKKCSNLHLMMKEAYQSAPMTDSGFGFSPVNGGTMMFSMKRHLLKKGLRLDNSYISDLDKVPSFSEYAKDAMKWLLKFST